MTNRKLFWFIALTIFSLGLAACGRETRCTADSKTCGYVDEFVVDATNAGVLVSVDVKSEDLGKLPSRCDGRTAVINEKFFERRPDNHLRFEVFHILGSCSLHRPQDSTLILGGMPKSLMYEPTGLYFGIAEVAAYFDDNEEYFLNELFTGKVDSKLTRTAPACRNGGCQ